MTRRVMPDVTVIIKDRARIGQSHWNIQAKAVVVLIKKKPNQVTYLVALQINKCIRKMILNI
jgi:hypothetical protein